MGNRETRDYWNGCRFNYNNSEGHCESYFQRANHPSRPLAFWIRYTIYVPKGRVEEGVGEVWSIFFDGENHSNVMAREKFPLSECRFSKAKLDVVIGKSILQDGLLMGRSLNKEHNISWAMTYQSKSAPLLLTPKFFYNLKFPPTKVLVGSPNALYNGKIQVDDNVWNITDWIGSQNHNWGIRHPDGYSWGQVAEFDGHPNSFLECATSTIPLGPLKSRMLSVINLRFGGQEHNFNSLQNMFFSKGNYSFFDWQASSRSPGAVIKVKFKAPKSAFVALAYPNPPGGSKTCLNSKIASCTLTLERRGQIPLILRSENRAAFEILTDDDNHGVELSI